MIDLWFLIVLLLILLAFDQVTVAARVGLLNTSLPRLLAQGESSDKSLERTIRLIQNLPRLQASLNLARLVWRFMMVGVIMAYVLGFSQPPMALVVIGVLLLAAFGLFWLEWVVSVGVMRDPMRWALRLTPYANILVILLTPFVMIPLLLSGEMESVPDATGPIMVTEDDLRTMVDASQQEGLLEQEEQKMIYSIFDLGNTLAREIMIPRIDVLAFDVNTDLSEAVDALLQSGFSRVPVYEDTIDNIKGLLYAKDLLGVWRQANQNNSILELLRPAYFVPEAKKIDDLLTEMQSQRVHMAIVVDEYGGVAGVVTLEDIVEEILGEIQDEYDQAEESPYEALPNGEYLFLGRIDLDDFNEVVTSHLVKDEADTLGGLLYSRLGRVPTSGESVQVDNMLLTIEQVSGRRIHKVHMKWLVPEEDSREQTTDVNKRTT